MSFEKQYKLEEEVDCSLKLLKPPLHASELFDLISDLLPGGHNNPTKAAEKNIDDEIESIKAIVEVAIKDASHIDDISDLWNEAVSRQKKFDNKLRTHCHGGQISPPQRYASRERMGSLIDGDHSAFWLPSSDPSALIRARTQHFEQILDLDPTETHRLKSVIWGWTVAPLAQCIKQGIISALIQLILSGLVQIK